VKSSNESETGALPSEESLIEMGKFNERLINAGVMLAGEGLRESAKGARLRFDRNGKATVVDGPFAEAKELVGGFWIVKAKSKAEVIDLFSGAPFRGGELEIRQVAESADFDPVINTEEGRAMLAGEDEFRKRAAQ
jgi:hypothetical protein